MQILSGLYYNLSKDKEKASVSYAQAASIEYIIICNTLTPP
jgi:hypothetical protein